MSKLILFDIDGTIAESSQNVSLEMKENDNDIKKVDFEKNILQKAISDLEGTWAIVILFKYTPDKLYLCKNGSPLVIGIDDNFALVSSEQLPLSRYFNNYITHFRCNYSSK